MRDKRNLTMAVLFFLLGIIIVVLLLMSLTSCSSGGADGCRKVTMCWRQGAKSGIGLYKKAGWTSCKSGYTAEHIEVCD